MPVDQLLTQARRNATQAASPAERFRWLLIVAILEGSKSRCKPG